MKIWQTVFFLHTLNQQEASRLEAIATRVEAITSSKKLLVAMPLLLVKDGVSICVVLGYRPIHLWPGLVSLFVPGIFRAMMVWVFPFSLSIEMRLATSGYPVQGWVPYNHTKHIQTPGNLAR